jgi:tetratricopeptide (TPR) repeat protein
MASFLGLGFITSNLAFATGTIFAERLYYAPSLGVCALVAFGFDRLLSVQPRRLAPALGVACIWALGSVSVVLARNGAWRDSATLFLVEARNQPRSADMLVKAAGVLRAVGEADADRQAIAYLERALALVAEYPHALRERAALHLRRGAFDRALADYTRAWRSPYLELADTRSLAVAGMVEAWVGKGALPEPRELAPELALAVAGVLADAGRASDARRFLQSVANDPSASAALRERAAVISRAAPR